MEPSNHIKSQLELSRNYHDVKGVDNLRRAAQSGDKGALEEAANQFEAIFVQMLLKTMRKAQEALADKDSPFNSEQVKFYRGMHDQQMAVDLSSKGSFGLAKLIVQQLGPQQEGFTPASVIRSDGNLPNRDDQAQSAQKLSASSNSEDATGPTKQSAFASVEEFISTLMPIAEEVASKIGLAPQAMIAQAAVETGWGQFMIHNAQGKNSHNLFGIKAGGNWQGDKTAIDTLEYREGIANQQKASFRSYDSFAHSLEDYVSFVRDNPRYRQALDKVSDPQQYFEAIQKAGYATDPNYANKVMSVLKGQFSEFMSALTTGPSGGEF